MGKFSRISTTLIVSSCIAGCSAVSQGLGKKKETDSPSIFDDGGLLKVASEPPKYESELKDKIKIDSSAVVTGQKTEHKQLAIEAIKLVSSGDLEKASEKINAALQLKPTVSGYHLLNGITYHLIADKGDHRSYELAEQGYKIAKKMDKSNWYADYYLGRLYIDLGKFSLAQTHLTEALSLNNRDAAVYRSLAYAAYRAGNPELAAAAISGMEQKIGSHTKESAKNAAVIMAALGEEEKSDNYLKNLASSSSSHRIERRISDWNDLYERSKKQGLIKVVDDPYGGDDSGGGDPYGGDDSGGGDTGEGEASAEASGDKEASGEESAVLDKENKMVVVDVVIIRTEETLTTQRGVNLLTGLQLQFGGAMGNGGQDSVAWGRGTTKEHQWVGDSSTPPTTVTSTITRSLVESISIPGITYTLNLANSNNQRNEILARPTIIAANGKPSEFFSGVELEASAVATGAQGGESVSVSKEIGVKLLINPEMMDDGRIRLGVDAERTFLKTPSSDVNFTFRVETSKTKVNANVVMRFGETLILSGLSEKEVENQRDGVPLLQDVPVVQYLFSQKSTKEFQKSVMILLTPRPANYIYQSDRARKAHAKTLTPDERPIANLRARYSDWFRPYPNWASVFNHMQGNNLYREFRTGDVKLESWSDMRTLSSRLNQVSEFIWY